MIETVYSDRNARWETPARVQFIYPTWQLECVRRHENAGFRLTLALSARIRVKFQSLHWIVLQCSLYALVTSWCVIPGNHQFSDRFPAARISRMYASETIGWFLSESVIRTVCVGTDSIRFLSSQRLPLRVLELSKTSLHCSRSACIVVRYQSL